MQDHVVKGGKVLRLGYTTGSCATAAAVASATMLLSGEILDQALIVLPSGEEVVFSIDEPHLATDRASCSVKKDAGDDPDVTDGMRIVVVCEKRGQDLELHGDEGIGRVTSPGLSVPQGQAAINPVPRKMILENVRATCARYGYEHGLRITVSAPGGEQVAKRTFNPRLGIVGGISILGTTGIVEPMSEKAVVDTIKLLIDKRKLADADNILLTPGNYGAAFCREHLGLHMPLAVKYSNYLGECLDYLVYKGFKRVLLVGHAGKLIKVAGGIMQTHSSMADCRMEIIAAHAACAGADPDVVRSIMKSITTEEALQILAGTDYSRATFNSMLEKLLFHLEYRVKQKLEIGVLVFAGNGEEGTVLMQSANAMELVACFTPQYAGEKV